MYSTPVKIIENPGPLRVLLVEDSLPIRSRIRSLIEESVPAVCIVGEAADAERAIEVFVEQMPDAVVLDLHLEGSTGYTVLEEIKRRHPICVVIILTSFAIPECRERCMHLGADYFFEKSTEFERVPDTLLALSLNRSKSGTI